MSVRALQPIDLDKQILLRWGGSHGRQVHTRIWSVRPAAAEGGGKCGGPFVQVQSLLLPSVQKTVVVRIFDVGAGHNSGPGETRLIVGRCRLDLKRCGASRGGCNGQSG